MYICWSVCRSFPFQWGDQWCSPANSALAHIGLVILRIFCSVGWYCLPISVCAYLWYCFDWRSMMHAIATDCAPYILIARVWKRSSTHLCAPVAWPHRHQSHSKRADFMRQNNVSNVCTYGWNRRDANSSSLWTVDGVQWTINQPLHFIFHPKQTLPVRIELRARRSQYRTIRLERRIPSVCGSHSSIHIYLFFSLVLLFLSFQANIICCTQVKRSTWSLNGATNEHIKYAMRCRQRRRSSTQKQNNK